MRSHSLLRKSRLLFNRSRIQGQSLVFNGRTPLLENGLHKYVVKHRLACRSLSTVAPSEATSSLTSTPTPESDQPPERSAPSPPEEPEKPKTRRARITTSSPSKDEELPPELPDGLEREILYSPRESLLGKSSVGFPPPEIFEEALDKLLITLHPQNQARSIHPSTTWSPTVEPSLGLYCPIEGGEGIIDLTVHELAYQTGSDVVILDAVQLAAGEWGMFGKAANVLDLSENPLHFAAPHIPEPPRNFAPFDEREEENPFPQRMSIAIPQIPGLLQSRAFAPTSSRKPSPPSKLELFFDSLVNITLPKPEEGSESTPANPTSPPPRLIYIRDFPTLAPSSSTWYPALLNAVKQRRRNSLDKSSNIPTAPVTVIFGMSPAIAPHGNRASGPTSGIMSMLVGRKSVAQVAHSAVPDQPHDWSESETAEIARERRLRSRLKKWERGSAALYEELPRLHIKGEVVDRSKGSLPEIIVFGSTGADSDDIGGSADSHEDKSSQFFRSAVIVPRSRSPTAEKECRIIRRREINELTIRMAVGAVGGVISSNPAFPDSEPPQENEQPNLPDVPRSPMWGDWGNRIEPWSNVRRIADRAVGSVLVSRRNQGGSFVVPTPIPWDAVQAAWAVCTNLLGPSRKSWLKENMGAALVEDQEQEGLLRAAGSNLDTVVENLKNDPDLDQHEARLLPCIVDTNSLTTTFRQVHLPNQTVDAVRTIVSLPLLHPHAFQQGILKEHGMTGCLLFGPPGTGKTLVVKALAKEAGCRMLAISPSDVMDMYVGEGEKLVKAVFSLARKVAPCVVFLDEIDALFGARMSARESGSAFAQRGVITEFMQEMDGLRSSVHDQIVVIGATNRPFDLDDAVLRRLPRRLLVDLPGKKERQEILKILLRDENLAEDVSISKLARQTDGFSGSDLKHLCVSAALDSIKEQVDLPWVTHHQSSEQTDNSLPSEASSIGGDQSQATTVPKEIAAEPSAASPSVADASVTAEPPLMESVQPTDVPSVAAETPSKAEPVQHTDPMPAAAETPSASESVQPTEATPPPIERQLHSRHFAQALKEIVPSSSESLGSLTDLRKWNEEFGEGRKDRKKHQVWGKGHFGFIRSVEGNSAK